MKMWTVKKLITALQKHDPKRIIVLSRDAEGNGYDTLFNVSTGSYLEGEVGLELLTPELESFGYAEEDVLDDGEPCLILSP